MVNTRRTSAGTNPSNPPLIEPPGLSLDGVSNLGAHAPNPNAPGSSRAPPPTVILTLDELQKFVMDCQKKAFAEARAELLTTSTVVRPQTTMRPAQVRPPPPTPAARQPRAPRREGPTDSTVHTPGSRPPDGPREAARGARVRLDDAGPPVEDIAESTQGGPQRTSEQRGKGKAPERPMLEEVSHQIQQLSRQVEDLARRDRHQPPQRAGGRPRLDSDQGGWEEKDRASPFSEEIAREKIGPDGSIPTSLPRYDGSADPMQHLLKFEHIMELHGHSPNICAKILVTTLQDLALEWFTRLPPGSISSYRQLTGCFLHQFASKRRARMPYTSLYSVKQGEGETTREFVERFNNEVLKVETPAVEFLVDVLYFGLKNKALAGALAREKPISMERLHCIIDSYVKEEEMNRIKYGAKEKKKGKDREPTSAKEGRRSPVRRFHTYTTLNSSRKEVLLAIQKEDILRKPRRISETPLMKASGKYCLYHKQKGHDTEECYALLDEIERLIQQGYLKKFLARDKAKRQEKGNNSERRYERSRSPRPRQENAPSRGVIDMIAGGPTGGDTKSSRKRVERVLRNSTRGFKSVWHVNKDGSSITFDESDVSHVPKLLEKGQLGCPLVIAIDLSNFTVRRALVDNGSSVNIIFQSTLDKMQMEGIALRAVRTPLVGFGGSEVMPKGILTLPTSLGEGLRRKTLMIEYLVVEAPFAYNLILGRPALNDFRAVTSTYHMKLKFPTPNGTGEAKGDLQEAWKCYTLSLERKKAPIRAEQKNRLDIDIKDLATPERKRSYEDTRMEPSDPYKTVELIVGNPDRTTRIGSNLDDRTECLLIGLLRKNRDIFAWKASELEGVDPAVMVHRLNVDPSVKPVRQKERVFGEERNQIISTELEKLLEANYVREVQYAEWLCNVVVVPKAEGKWRMCNDFTDLNKACPKDPYPLPRIDALVDSTAGCEMMSMMDAFQGYYQISMAPEDQDKTSFVVRRGTYCFLVMPFGLKNAGATYQRLVNMIFKESLGKTVEVYVDDMIVKSAQQKNHLHDLTQAFDTLRRYRLKLNPAKCTFGVKGGRFLGYMVSERGIEANPEKIQAIKDITSPRSVKDVQRLVGRIIALSRFISRLAEKSLPFFKAIRSAKKFEWTEECERALRELKAYLGSPPLLAKPQGQERLGLYLAVSGNALSSVLVSIEQGHKPIYYISKILQGAEKNYPEIELFALALVHAARRLRPYFQSHSITVLTDQPLRQILAKPTSSGRLVKWAVELSEFEVEFKPRVAIKAQALADFLLEKEQSIQTDNSGNPSTLEVDGSSLGAVGGVGVHLRSNTGLEMDLALRLDFPITNNEAEYEAVLAGMRMAAANGIKNVVLLTDSQLVASQFDGTFETREENLQAYLSKMKEMVQLFTSFSLQQVPRTENSRADALSKLASSSNITSGSIAALCAKQPAIAKEVHSLLPSVEKGVDWGADIIEYLRSGILPDDRYQARRIRIRAARYFIADSGHLFRKSIEGPPLKCLRSDAATMALAEIHGGICGNHTSGRVLAQKIKRAGYYWPSMLADSIEYVRKCRACQFNAPGSSIPPAGLIPIQSAWPFEQWGIDLVGPFPPASGQRKFLVVAIEYFTKWVEAEALAKVTDAVIWNFVWKNIICRFGLPRILISDNGSQFQNRRMKERCGELGIEQRFASVGRPQANGQTEVTNRTIVNHLRTRLGNRKGTWADDLPAVLWSYRTTPRTATGDTPFALVYGSDAVMPVERMEESIRCLAYHPERNKKQILMDLDFTEERRLQALMRTTICQERMKKAYNAKIRPRSFRKGDWVLKRVEVSKHVGKLDPPWDGPYKVIAEGKNNTYRLTDEDGNELPRPWNASNLRKFYV